jgi:hypothetical protein
MKFLFSLYSFVLCHVSLFNIHKTPIECLSKNINIKHIITGHADSSHRKIGIIYCFHILSSATLW